MVQRALGTCVHTRETTWEAQTTWVHYGTRDIWDQPRASCSLMSPSQGWWEVSAHLDAVWPALAFPPPGDH